MNKLQRGFTVIETLVGFIAIAAIAYGGYYVWHNNHERKTSQTTTSSTVSKAGKLTTPCSGPDGTYNGVTYVSANNTYNFCEPAGWDLLETEGNSGLIDGGSLRYTSGAKTTVTKAGGKDGPFTFSLLFLDNNSDIAAARNNLLGYTNIGSITAKNITGINYYHLTGTKDLVGAGIDYLTKGTKQYLYYFEKNEKVVQINYNLMPGAQDETALVKEVAQSLTLN